MSSLFSPFFASKVCSYMFSLLMLKVFLPIYFLAHESPFEKGPALKGKKLLSKGANSLLFKVDLFSERRQINFERITSPENIAVPL